MISKNLKIKVFNSVFEINFFRITIFLFIYILGVIVSYILPVTAQDNLFSPFIIYYTGESLLAVIVHSFLYFFLFPSLAFFLATSYFGYAFIPFLLFVKSYFSSLSVVGLVIENFISIRTIFYLIILSLEIAVIIIYFNEVFVSSFSIKSKSNNIEFQVSLNHSVVVLFSMTFLAVICTAFKYMYIN